MKQPLHHRPQNPTPPPSSTSFAPWKVTPTSPSPVGRPRSNRVASPGRPKSPCSPTLIGERREGSRLKRSKSQPRLLNDSIEAITIEGKGDKGKCEKESDRVKSEAMNILRQTEGIVYNDSLEEFVLYDSGKSQSSNVGQSSLNAEQVQEDPWAEEGPKSLNLQSGQITIGIGSNRPQVSFRTVSVKPACLAADDMDDFQTKENFMQSHVHGLQLDRRRTERNLGRDRKGSRCQISRVAQIPKASDCWGELDLYDPSLFASASLYMAEGYLNVSPSSLSYLLIDQGRYTPYYRHCFYNKEHTNYLAYSDIGPTLVSVEKINFDSNMPSVPCRVFLRTCIPWSSESEADIWVVVTPTDEKNFKKSLEKEFCELFKTSVRIVELQESSQELFLKLEDAMMVKNYKFGVLSWNSHQKTEDEIFGNTAISSDFQEFLDFLGDVVTLEGWPFYRGGLDVKANATGEKSVFTRFLDYEVMFHVGAFLPHGEGEQQLGKKRHIGNDIVVIVFKELTGEEALFDPSIFVSDFNHIFFLVEKMQNEKLKNLYEKKILASFDDSKTYYRVGVCSKQGVHSAEPLLPFPGIFEKNDNFRHFLLTKVLNSERSALYAQKFVTKMAKTRSALFLDVADDLAKLEKKKEKPSKKKGVGT